MESKALCSKLMTEVCHQASRLARRPAPRRTENCTTDFSLLGEPSCLTLRDAQYRSDLLRAKTQRAQPLAKQQPIGHRMDIRILLQSVKENHKHLKLGRLVQLAASRAIGSPRERRVAPPGPRIGSNVTGL